MAISLRTKAGLSIRPVVSYDQPIEISEEDYHRICEAFFIEVNTGDGAKTYMRDNSSIIADYINGEIEDYNADGLFIFTREVYLTSDQPAALGGASVFFAWEQENGGVYKHFCSVFEY